MLTDLKAVMGAVARKDYVPALTHFRISGGRIEGFNGRLAISVPTDLTETFFPKAVSFVKAIESIPDGADVALNLTNSGRLSIKAGAFRAYVECLPEDAASPVIVPQGSHIALPNGLLSVLAKLTPFMGIDSSRPWAMGILLKGQSAFATNNIILVEHWMPELFPVPLCLPSDAVKEMLRIGVEPVSMQQDTNAVTFHYASGAWLRTAVGALEWPNLSKVLDRPSTQKPIPEGFFEAVHRLAKLADKTGRIWLRGGTLATSADEGEGALVELPDFGGVGLYFVGQLASLDGVAETIDLSLYPSPCLFFKGPLRGAIIGMLF
jgi:hypothetical protein